MSSWLAAAGQEPRAQVHQVQAARTVVATEVAPAGPEAEAEDILLSNEALHFLLYRVAVAVTVGLVAD